MPAETADETEYYSISQTAALLGVSRVSIWRWIGAGKLPASRLGHRTVRITHEDVGRALMQVGPSGSGIRGLGRRKAEPEAEENADGRRSSHIDWTGMGASEHFVQFYESDTFLLDAVSDFITAGLQLGETGIVVATKAHREGIDERFRAGGLDVSAVRARGQYVSLDAAETLSTLMVGDAFDPGRFVDIIGGVVALAAASGTRVRIFGEMVALLAIEGDLAAAIRLEESWNDLQRTHSFALFCAYPMEPLGGGALGDLVKTVCGLHSSVIPAESYTALPTRAEGLRAVAVLQQKARRLEAELAERREAEERVRAALASERAALRAAEEALKVRDAFLSIAAHELKTPLTSLLGYAQLSLRRLTRGGQVQPEHVAATLQSIAGQADKLARLVNQLFDISLLETGKLELQRETTDLAPLVEQVVSAARAWSDRHTITLNIPISLMGEVDPLRLEQVLNNLLDNAIKYSPEGGPVEVALVQRESAAVELSVRDHGLGVPPEKRGQIFERFYQAHDEGRRSGMGLGLYIVQQIVELHRGAIRAEFPPEGGTRFVMCLPL